MHLMLGYFDASGDAAATSATLIELPATGRRKEDDHQLGVGVASGV